MLAGTIVASNYLEMARVLAETFLQHHRDGRFVIVVVDDLPVRDLGDRVEIMRLGDLGIDPVELDVMLTIYDVREFCTAVKPALLRRLLVRADVACYLDPDIVVYAPFDDVVDGAAATGILLTPHVLRPVPRDGRDVSERTLMLSGMYNLGFAAVGRSARPFLDWWHERLVTDAVIDFENALFTDQRWVDWVAALFPHEVCRDPGMNVAWWNLHERTLELHDGVPFVDGAPVRFVHFSGYDPSTPATLCKWQPQPRTGNEPGSPIRMLADAYGDRLVGAGHVQRRAEPYRWDRAADGTRLTPELRRMWRRELLAELGSGVPLGSTTTPPAFGDRHRALRPWLEAVVGGTDDHPHARIERLVWDRRPDLQVAFPDVDGADAEHFRAWLDVEPDAARELGGFVPAGLERVPPTRPRPAAPGGIGTLGATARTGRRVAARVVRGGHRTVRRAVSRARGVPDAPPVGGRTVRPMAFLHVPKCAGTSMKEALRTALDGHRWAPWTFDPVMFGPLADRALTPELAAQTVPTPAALAGYDATVGHFALPTLLAAFDPADVVTVLREPRCRLLSHHQYWRYLPEEQRELAGPWGDITRTAQREEFGSWLSDPGVAYQTDNLFIRQLAPDHPAIPTVGFIADRDADQLVREGIRLLRRLGWVDVIERGTATWDDLGRRVGVGLDRLTTNVTERDPGVPNDVDGLLGAAATGALAARTRIDRHLWIWAASQRGVADPHAVAEIAWGERLARTIGVGAR